MKHPMTSEEIDLRHLIAGSKLDASLNICPAEPFRDTAASSILKED
jgi:hypothetical protein